MLIPLTTTQEIMLFLFSELSSLLQEIYSTKRCVYEWKSDWQGCVRFTQNCVACQKTERVGTTEGKV